MQIKVISQLFNSTSLCIPYHIKDDLSKLEPLAGKNLKFYGLHVNPFSNSFLYKVYFPIWFIKNIQTLYTSIKKSSLVHCIVPGSVGLVGIFLMMFFRKKGFIRYCGNWESKNSFFTRFTIRLIKLISNDDIISFVTGASNKPPYKYNKYISWIHSSSLDSKRIKKFDKIPVKTLNDKINILYVGRLEKYKGTQYIIEAIENLQHSLPQISLSIVGNGGFYKKLIKLVKDKNLEQKVKFYGQIKNNNIMKFYNDATLFCFPSASEGFPKVIVEAMASGTPVICSNIPVLRTLINESNGYILESLSADSIVKGIINLTKDKNRIKRLSVKIKKDSKSLTLEKFAKKIEEQIKHLVE